MRPSNELLFETPWPKPDRTECEFYHSFDFPSGVSIESGWDIRGQFPQYVGNIDLKGRTVLDVGTASGFLAFSAEQAGAVKVSATELGSLQDMDRVPFLDSPYMRSKSEWSAANDLALRRIKNSFWYSWHTFGSRVEASYGNLQALLSTQQRWDIVFAGALMEHLENPVSVVGALCRVARHQVIICFTPVDLADEPSLRPLSEWTNPQHDYVWWIASKGLYDRVFENMGFRTDYLESTARHVPSGALVTRSTIVATRRSGGGII